MATGCELRLFGDFSACGFAVNPEGREILFEVDNGLSKEFFYQRVS